MKKQFIFRPITAFLILASASAALAGGTLQTDGRSKTTDEFQNKKSIIEGKYQQLEQKFFDRYIAALDALQQKYQAAANLDAIVEIQNERERYTSSRHLSAQHFSRTQRYLQDMQKQAYAAYQRMNGARQHELQNHVKSYEQKLKDEVVALTKAGRLQEALQLRAELQAMQRPSLQTRSRLTRHTPVQPAPGLQQYNAMDKPANFAKPQPVFGSPMPKASSKESHKKKTRHYETKKSYSSSKSSKSYQKMKSQPSGRLVL